MSVGWKPAGHSTVSPYLIASGADRVMAFLREAFGAEEVRRFDAPDGSLVHGEMRIGDTVVMMGEAGGEWPAVPCHVHVYVEDVEGTFRRAVAAGGVAVEEPRQREGDPDRRGGVRGPADNTWWIATQTSATGEERGR